MGIAKMFDLVKRLQDKNLITQAELMSQWKKSKKQIQAIVEETNQQIEGAAIVWHAEKEGYYLKITNPEEFRENYAKLRKRKEPDMSKENRVRLIILHLLEHTDYIKIEELADRLYISGRQVSKDLQEVREILENYHIELNATPHYGLIAAGEEIEKRKCIADVYSQMDDMSEKIENVKEIQDNQLEVLREIKEIVTETFNKYDFKVVDGVFENLMIHLYISMLRVKEGNEIQMDIPKLLEEREMEISTDILKNISKTFRIPFSTNECVYLATHLKGKKYYSTDCAENIPAEVSDLVIEILTRIDLKYNTRLRRDFELCMLLSLHCMPLVSRLEYGLKQRNPLLQEIKARFVYEFEMAEEGCKVLEEKYHCQIIEDEIAFIALIIRVAVEKRHNNEKYRILLVCSTGRGSAELLRLKFRERFGAYIESLDMCSVSEAENRDLESYQYIFTTVPLLIKTNTPIFRINVFLGSSDLMEIDGIFRTINIEKKCQKYFPEVLFMGASDFTDKQDALKKMVDHIGRYKEIPKEFLSSVLKRENMANTSFGNQVAFPHPQELLTEDTFVCVAISKKPLDWGGIVNAKVQLILLASIEREKNRNLQDFYKMISRIANSERNVDLIIHRPEYEILSEILSGEKR